MSEILNLDVLNPQSRKIVLNVAGCSRLPAFLLKFFPKKSKQIEIEIKPMSFRQSLELNQKYIEIVSKSIEHMQDAADLSKAEELQQMMIDFVVTALRPSFPPVSEDWISRFLDEAAFAKVFEFIAQPIQEKILKNAETLRGLLAK